ncbi:hypothetical protein L484_024128 [Morus notabilis]|uniref:RNase H type-1 domain-containing protein n=1 Tax=Morus notabilis TaxID=981085 RepID=W9RM78_9ROSA|nr:hypothetical protein L484_024128 [Morus notabilis]
MAKTISGNFSSFMAECFAVREGLKFAAEVGLNVSVVQTDARNVVESITQRIDIGLKRRLAASKTL